MISLLIVFYLFLVLFAFIGAARGWAKEVLVIFSVTLGMAFISVLEDLLPFIGPVLKGNQVLQFWVRISIIVFMTYFGYQSPKISRFSKASERKDRIQDNLLGLIMGLISGYFVVGTLWYYMHMANYPLIGEYIWPLGPDVPGGSAALSLMNYLPPAWLGSPPLIYIAVVLAFIFVIVVFL